MLSAAHAVMRVGIGRSCTRSGRPRRGTVQGSSSRSVCRRRNAEPSPSSRIVRRRRFVQRGRLAHIARISVGLSPRMTTNAALRPCPQRLDQGSSNEVEVNALQRRVRAVNEHFIRQVDEQPRGEVSPTVMLLIRGSRRT